MSETGGLDAREASASWAWVLSIVDSNGNEVFSGAERSGGGIVEHRND
jgi:hypothetical protein